MEKSVMVGILGIGLVVGAILGYLFFSEPETIEVYSGVRVIPEDPDILMVDVRSKPILVYTTKNISLAKTLSNISDKEMEYYLKLANMTVEEREAYIDEMLKDAD